MDATRNFWSRDHLDGERSRTEWNELRVLVMARWTPKEPDVDPRISKTPVIALVLDRKSRGTDLASRQLLLEVHPRSIAQDEDAASTPALL